MPQVGHFSAATPVHFLSGVDKRVLAGLESAKRRGIHGGRPRTIDEEKLQAIQQALREGMSKAAVCRNFAVKRSTLIDALKRQTHS